MPVLGDRTKVQMRQSVGYNLLGQRFHVGVTTSEVDASSVLDTSLRGGDNSHNGEWVLLTSGTNLSEFRSVSDFANATGDLTVPVAFSNSVASGVTFELWAQKYAPDWVENVMDQVILETYARAYDPVEVKLHTGGGVSRFDMSTGIAAIQKVMYRSRFKGEELHACDRVFDETLETGLTAALDTFDRRKGDSVKITVATGAAASAKITDSITSKNISGMTHLEGWIKSSITIAAGAIDILLDDTASCASPLETIAMPALTAGVWTRFEVALANPQDDTAIISVGVQFTTDSGAQTCWVDDLIATNVDSATYDELHPHAYRIDKEAVDFILTETAMHALGYSQLKIKGGDKPTLLTADSTVSEVSSTYIVNATTAQIFLFGGEKDLQAHVFWARRAKEARQGLMRIRGARKVR